MGMGWGWASGENNRELAEEEEEEEERKWREDIIFFYFNFVLLCSQQIEEANLKAKLGRKRTETTSHEIPAYSPHRIIQPWN